MSLYFSISLRIRYVYGRIIPPYICYFMQCMLQHSDEIFTFDVRYILWVYTMGCGTVVGQ